MLQTEFVEKIKHTFYIHFFSKWLHERASILRYTYMVWLVSNLRSKKSAQFMEASIHNIHCHAAIEGKIVCRLISVLVNKQQYNILTQFFWFKTRTELFLIAFHLVVKAVKSCVS